MHVVQTSGLPPNHGRMNLPMSGWTWKRRNAPTKTAIAYVNIINFSFKFGLKLSFVRMQLLSGNLQSGKSNIISRIGK